MLDPNRPIYPRAPLKLVTFQIRFPQIPELDEVTPAKLITAALRERYPILGGPPPVLQVELGPGQAVQRTRGSRFMNRERTRSVTLTGDSVAVETSQYERYERFAEEVDWVLAQVNDSTPIPAVTRVGLRYIDEIEVEGVTSLSGWRPWINEDLIVGANINGYETKEYLTQLALVVDDVQQMTLRYGRVSQPVVDPKGVLRINGSPLGPYFLLDIDSFWEPSRDAFKEFDAVELRDVCLRLHDPIRDIFERAISSELRHRFAEEETT
jgi:uncharacterized protein (TIGR04255 family)